MTNQFFTHDTDPIVGGKSNTMNTDISRAASDWLVKWGRIIDPENTKSRHQAYREKKKKKNEPA